MRKGIRSAELQVSKRGLMFSNPSEHFDWLEMLTSNAIYCSSLSEKINQSINLDSRGQLSCWGAA